MITGVARLAGAALLLSACGDGSEGTAATAEQPVAAGDPLETAAPEDGPVSTIVDDVPEDDGDDAAQVEEVIQIDAEPEMFIDDAQGFSTDPVDDTSGFDPTPADPQSFDPDAVEEDGFED